VATEVGMSERWYRQLERGGAARLDPRILPLLAGTLLLDTDERAALYLFALGGSSHATQKQPVDASSLSALQGLVDRQLPHPAYVTDRSWNIVGHNRAMAEWFPWVADRDANILRWVLLTQEAREQVVDWPWHARLHLAMVRFALAEYPDDADLRTLVGETLRDPVCRKLWEGRTCVVASLDGYRFGLRLPHVAPESMDVALQVLIPAGHQSLRLALIV
jgi:PAS domain-containing protein